jgi:hypothetical protein
MSLLKAALLERGLTVEDLPNNLFLGDWVRVSGVSTILVRDDVFKNQ